MPYSADIIYPHAPQGDIKVSRLVDPQSVEEEHAIALLCLLNASYSQTYEIPRGSVPEGYFRSFFDPQSLTQIRNRREVMKMALAEGAQYMFIEGREKFKDLPWTGVLKSRLVELEKVGTEEEVPIVAIDDILAVPRGRGWGSALMHSLTAHSGLDDRSKVQTKVFADNRKANAWYAALGFEYMHVMPSSAFGRVVLERALYRTPAHGVKSIREQLEMDKLTPGSGQFPWLSHAVAGPGPGNPDMPQA